MEGNILGRNPGLAKLSSEELAHLRDAVLRYHTHKTDQNQCSSMVVQWIRAPAAIVWSMVRGFDNPQAYKLFIRRCFMHGDGQVGSTREVELVSGFPAASSTERLEILDDERHIFSFKVVGGQHRLHNYCSVTTLHEFQLDAKPATIVVESYTVDIPDGNTSNDTQMFVNTIVNFNLTSLARISEHRAKKEE